MPWPKTVATHNYAQLGLPNKGCAIKGLVVCMAFDRKIMHIMKQDLVYVDIHQN